MGKAGKKTRKFAKNHLKSVIKKRHETKPMRNAFKRKKTALQNSVTREKSSVQEARKEGQDKFRTTKIQKDSKVAEDVFLNDARTEDDSTIEETSSESDFVPSEDEFSYLDIGHDEFSEDESEGEDDDDATSSLQGQNKILQSEIDECKNRLESITEKDPKFLLFLKEHEDELHQELNTVSEDDEDDLKQPMLKDEMTESSRVHATQLPSKRILTTAHVDVLCKKIKEKQNIGALRFLLHCFKTACYYGDGGKHFSSKIRVTRSSVYNKVVCFVFDEMDGILRKLLKLPSSDGKKEIVLNMKDSSRWKELRGLIKSYFMSTCHLLNEVTDKDVISYIVIRLRCSIILLLVFPNLSRKVSKVILNLWGNARGPVSRVSFLFVCDMISQLSSDRFQYYLRKLYNVFAMNCRLVNSTNFRHIEFLKNSIVDIYRIDLVNASHLAFERISKLSSILQRGLTLKTKESLKEAYSWQYINCVDLWVKFVCQPANYKDFQSIYNPLAQIVIGVMRLVPTARYAPLRLWCASMLNKLSSCGRFFIPVSSHLLDILECKEFDKATSKFLKSFRFSTVLKVPKAMLKSHSFQEECLYSVLDILLEHLVQWSYHVSFPELAFPIVIRLRRLMEKKVNEKFRHQVKQFIDQVESNSAFVSKKRDNLSFSPKDHSAVSLFFQTEKSSVISPLEKYYTSLEKKPEFKKHSLRRARGWEDTKVECSAINDIALQECNGNHGKDSSLQNDNGTGAATNEIKTDSGLDSNSDSDGGDPVEEEEFELIRSDEDMEDAANVAMGKTRNKKKKSKSKCYTSKKGKR